MFEKDYIMRLIQVFSRMLAKIMGLKENGQFDEALQEVDHAYRTGLKLEPDSVRGFTPDQWEDFRQAKSIQEWEMVARLLKLEGEIRLDSGKPEGACYLLYTALDLLKAANEKDSAFSIERFELISQLEETLSGISY